MTTTAAPAAAAWFCFRCFETLNYFNRVLLRKCTSGSKLVVVVSRWKVSSVFLGNGGSGWSWRNQRALSNKLSATTWLTTITSRSKTEFAMGFFYAVARGRVPGVYMTWSECESQVKGFTNARYKKFPSQKEAEAFIDEHKDGNRGIAGMAVKNKAKVAAASSGVDMVDGFPNSWGRGQVGGGRSTQEISNGIKKSSQTFSAKSPVGIFKDGKKTLFCDPQPLLSSVSSRNLSTTGSLGKRGTSKIASDNKEFVTGKGNKRLKLCDANNFDLSSFEVDDDEYVVVYTDGACKSNGKGQARAGIGVWFGESHFLNISERVKTRQTNNTAEIQAAERAIRCAKQYGIGKLSLKTDSQFVLNCVGKWMSAWKRNNWKKGGPGGSEVINKDDLMILDETMKGIEIKWSYIPAHRGHVGNEGADKLAVEGSLMPLNS